MHKPSLRRIGTLTFVIVCSAVLPSIFSSLESAITPHFDPVTFGLPITAQEVVSKRTEKAVTFEITPGKFASVSTGDRLQSPSCDKAKLSTLCQAVSLVRGIIPYAFATSEGPNSPTTVIDDSSIGTLTWSTPSNAVSSDNTTTVAFDDQSSTDYTHYLNAQEFGFSIPTNSTVNGIYVEFERSRTNGVYDNVIKLIVNGTITGDNKSVGSIWSSVANPPNTYEGFGGSGDLWGLALQQSDINSTSFGVVISASLTTGPTQSARIDHIRMTVYYTEAAGPAPFFSWWSLPLMLLGCGWVLWKEGYLGGDMIQERN